MLIEVKAKVSWIIDTKIKKRVETYVVDKEVFAEAEYAVMSLLTNAKNEGTVNSFEIQSLKISAVKEIITQYQGEHSYIASLKDIFLQDDGTEKSIRYKVLLWANSISEAMNHTREIASQGYDMLIEGLKEVDYEYLIQSTTETITETNNIEDGNT